MSIRAMNWVWSLKLRPLPKLILLALADAADNAGVCWPSIPTISGLTEVSDRTVQRQIEYFRSMGLLVTEPRFRKDGSRTSNRYRLNLDSRGDAMSPGPGGGDTGGGQLTSPADDTPVRETTNEPTEHKPPQQGFSSYSKGDRAEDASGSGDVLLIYPEQLTTAELNACCRLVEEIDSADAQQLLDELNGRLAAGGVRLSPVAYLRTLVTRFHRAEFRPELALQVSESRRRKRESEERLQNARSNPSPRKSEDLMPMRLSHSETQKRLKALRDALNGKAQESPNMDSSINSGEQNGDC
jgi:hypothetical protein